MTASLAILSVRCPFLGVASGVRKNDRFRVFVIHQLLQKPTTPSTASSRAVAVGQLARVCGAFDSNVLHDFPTRNVEAEAQFFVIIHRWPRR